MIAILAFTAYLLYVLRCYIFYRSTDLPSTGNLSWPPTPVRIHIMKECWKSINTPLERRGWAWKLKSYWIEFCTIIHFAPSGRDPLNFFRIIQKEFSVCLNKSNAGGFFPFGDGIGVGAHRYVKCYLESRNPLIIKDLQSIGWSVSSSLFKYCDLTTIFLPNPSLPIPDKYLLSRRIVHQWLANFPHRLVDFSDASTKKNAATYRYLSRIVPRQPNSEPKRDTVYLAIGETIFFLATGGSLTSDERDAYLDCVKNPFTFLPDWFNFLIAGNHLESIGYSSYGKLQAAFARHIQGPALQAAFAAGSGKIPKNEILRLISSVYCLGAAPAPAKITANAIEIIWSDQTDDISLGIGLSNQTRMIDLFYENPRNFIKECARINPILSMVSVVSNDHIAQDIKFHTGLKIPPNTRIHCSLTNANHDPDVFTFPDLFNPRRSEVELGNIMTWNGSESEIEKKDENERPPRYCPGHDFSLQVMEFVVSRYAPISTAQYDKFQDYSKTHNTELLIQGLSGDSQQYSNVSHMDDDARLVVITIRELYSRQNLDKKTNQRYLSSLDGYTRLIMNLSKVALASWNGKPPRGIDITEPSNTTTQNLHLRRVDCARHVPTWDEDELSQWSFHRKLVNKILNCNMWPLEDHELQFNSLDDMIAWRWKHFPLMPPPNNPRWCGDSDELMSQFAFSGLACHHTRKIDPGKDTMQLHTTTLKHAIFRSTCYVNDMTALSLFAVRAPFDRYGAAAYFDSERRLIGIYICHDDTLVTPLMDARGRDNNWTYAKYMWRSSALAMVTIRDHLLTTHFIEANTLTSVSRQYLPVAHPLRVFLKPFTYRTVSVNHSAATSLVNQGGLCHRIWGFEYDEFLKLCDYVIAHYQFRILPDWIDDTMKMENCCARNQDEKHATDCTRTEWVKHYPIAEDIPAFWKIVRDYVERFFEIEYGKERPIQQQEQQEVIHERTFMSESCERRFIAELCKPLGLTGIPSRSRLIDVLAQLICACTGLHENVGHVGDYLYDPCFIGTKLRHDQPSLLPSVQNFTLMLVLTVLTGLRMPGLLEDWSHLIPRISTDNTYGKPYTIKSEQDVQSHLDNYYLFKYELVNLMEKINERNQSSDTFPFESFNPDLMECSVSV